MWTRRLSTNMGIAEEESIRAFSAALSNEDIIRKLQAAVVSQLRKEVSELRELVKGKDTQLEELRNRVSALEDAADSQEQYSRRNSLRISGVPEADNEDILKLSLDLFNEKMKLDPPVSTQFIDRVHRTGPAQGPKPRPILVKFATYQERKRVFKGRFTLKSHRREARPWIQDNSTDVQQATHDGNTQSSSTRISLRNGRRCYGKPVS